ncbi:MAG: VacB/RNase II family 3'-5' exoribonuclease [Phycisphaeraceae bacterium]
MHPRLQSRIIQHVTHDAYEPQNVRRLADALGVADDQFDDFQQAIGHLVEAGQIVLGPTNLVQLPPIGHEITGRFKLHERGFGFILPDSPNEHGDLFVPPGDNLGALTGDMVRAEVSHRKRGREAGVTGRIVEILQRGKSTFVGTLDKRGQLYVVFPDGRTITDPIIIRDIKAKNARIGDKVAVELTVWPAPGTTPRTAPGSGSRATAEGVITEVLGESGMPDAETLGVIRAYGLHDKISDDAIAEAREAAHDYSANEAEYFRGRLDLRDTFTLTIDPPDAKDFDDAISIAKLDHAGGGGGYELGIHIADVSTFVRPGAAMDEQARERGNSVYLPRRVLPMLPEVLSNGICSLQPGVPRLTKSVFIRYNHEGHVQNARYANAVIRSDFRLTYLEAEALIAGKPDEAKKHSVENNTYTDELLRHLAMMNDLSRIIRKRRVHDGMISLDLPEVELVFDDDGRVIDAHPEDDAYTHKLIEAFMVEANEAVARVFNDIDIPTIRRVHPDPSAHDTTELRKFARVAGYNIPSNPGRKELQGLLEATAGKPAAKAIHLAVLKTLTKAEYSPALIGHFALASEHYLHFTSPIRRYADLTVHRSLEALLEVMGSDKALPRAPAARKQLTRKLEEDDRCPDEATLVEIGRHISTTERNAESAERELRKFLVLQLMVKHVGDVFPATVTGCTGFGMFVQIDKYLIEGMIRTNELPGVGERWRLDEQTGAMTAQRSGRRIAIGDTFEVQIVKVDLPRREMDLRIIETSLKKSDKPKLKTQAEKAKPEHKKFGGAQHKKSGKRRR